ncbi:MAG TPA: hypothetical protein VGO68_05215 [Pyrinomonadaceae bacterium]|nr:hypothetical protein [Pyrinomonadaceae bacterium]
MQLRILPTGLLIALLLFSACTSESEKVHAEARRCATAIANGGDCGVAQTPDNKRAEPTPTDATAKNSPENGNTERAVEDRVYLDATDSMRGFVGTPDTTFTKVIESLSYAMPGSHLHKYGMTDGAVQKSGDFAREIRFTQELRRPSFYELDYNEDDLLFNLLAEEDPPARSVLVTDGVYSARQSELESEVVQAINKWLKKGRFFGILIFTSQFKGRLYSENRRTWLDGIDVGARPFYAFVFSPSEKGFRDLREKLAREFPGMQALVFPHEAVACPLDPIAAQGLVFKDLPPENAFYLHLYNQNIFGEKRLAQLTYDFRCEPVKDYPVAEFDLDVTVDSYSWSQESFKKAKHSQPIDFTYEGQTTTGETLSAASPAAQVKPAATTTSPLAAASPKPRLKIAFQKDTGTPYTFYHVIFNLSSKGLKPNIRSLTTEDDSEAQDAEKTYRFFEFISALTTLHLKNQAAIRPPPPVFVVLKNQ